MKGTKRTKIVLRIVCCCILIVYSFKVKKEANSYFNLYELGLNDLKKANETLLNEVNLLNKITEKDKEVIQQKINEVRSKLKVVDIWLRYLEPISYKLINGPLPVEWETEVFEKFEKPYKREGAGLTLTALYLEEDVVEKAELINLIEKSKNAIKVFNEDSITIHLKTADHFYLCNRLYLLNLATIYTTGFECPTPENIIPELKEMMKGVKTIYKAFNTSFELKLKDEYLNLYEKTLQYLMNQPNDFEKFDHFTFIKDYINPLFALNQKMIIEYKVVSKSYVDFSLNKQAISIFSKNLYNGQNTKGLFLRVTDKEVLNELEQLGKNLFYDPILSGNNQRSCASCHKPENYFADTSSFNSLQFNRVDYLQRNTPSLVNSQFNHLLMLDGFHISLQNQAKAVITNSVEMGANEEEVMKKVMSCKIYKESLKKLVKFTPQEKEITIEHVSSALTFYYSKFSKYYSPFDEMMNNKVVVNEEIKQGFNIYMSKAQCATCHFAPQFNGVKPPYVSSEFEVLGVPADKNYKELSKDRGRYEINQAKETLNAFRTGTIRNAMKTMPYMHNGVFTTMEEVIEFYNGGGGLGRGLNVPNQTLSSDSIHLNTEEKRLLIKFIESLTEEIIFEEVPDKLSASRIKNLNKRKVNGEY